MFLSLCASCPDKPLKICGVPITSESVADKVLNPKPEKLQ